MTKEAIKAAYSMQDIAERYDLRPNRSGFISCPFHQDRGPSFKVYEQDFHCFGCGANGDIFDFVQRMEDVTFREAFQILGGTYETPTFSSRLAVYRSRKRQAMLRKERQRLEDRKQFNLMLIGMYRRYMECSEPFSQVWTDCYNALQYQLYLHGELNGMELR